MARSKRAYRQGDLDGLCGVYAVVNAVRYVEALNEDQCEVLFRRLIRALGRGNRAHETLLWGMGSRKLKGLVAAARRCRFEDRELAFAVRPLRLRGKSRCLPGLWAALEGELGPTCVALVGITGVTDHWCVVYRVTAKTLWLLDSAGRSWIRRSRCTVRASRTRYCLEFSEILLIER
jgi:hypothetical protein